MRNVINRGQRACGRRQGCGHRSRTTVSGGRWATEVWWLIPGRSCGSMRRRVRGKYLAQLSNATRRQGVITLTDRQRRQGRLSPAAFGTDGGLEDVRRRGGRDRLCELNTSNPVCSSLTRAFVTAISTS